MIRFVAMMVVTLSFLSGGTVASEHPEEGVFYRLKNVNSKKVLALGVGAAKSDNTQIVQRSQGQDERQQWKFVAVGKYYRIVNRKTEQELNVRSKDEDDAVVASTDGKNAQWSLEQMGEAFLIKNA